MPQLVTTIKKFKRPDIGSMNNRIFIYSRDIRPPTGTDLNFTERFTPKLKCWASIVTPEKGVEIFDHTNVSRGIASHVFSMRNIPPMSVIGTPIFNGVGLNDLSSSGIYAFTSKLIFLLQIDSVGATDTFKWSIDNGVTWETLVPIEGISQSLSGGVDITFGAITGHTLGDSWQVVATAGMRISSQDWIFYQNQFMNVQSVFDILSVDACNMENRYLNLFAVLTGDYGYAANYA